MTPDNFVIVLKDSPRNITEGVEATYFAQRFARYDEETGDELEPHHQVFFKDSELPADVKADLDTAFAKVLTFLADK